MIVRHFALSVYKMTKKVSWIFFENPGFFIYRDCPAVIEGENLETMDTKEAHSKSQKLECQSLSWNA